MAETTLKIEGMSCRHCVMRVKKAVEAVAGVSGSDVKIGSATVTFDEAKAKKEDLEKAVEQLGFKIAK